MSRPCISSMWPVNGKAYALEQSYVRQDGSVTWFAVTANAVFDEQGQFRYSLRVISPSTSPQQYVKS